MNNKQCHNGRMSVARWSHMGRTLVAHGSHKKNNGSGRRTSQLTLSMVCLEEMVWLAPCLQRHSNPIEVCQHHQPQISPVRQSLGLDTHLCYRLLVVCQTAKARETRLVSSHGAQRLREKSTQASLSQRAKKSKSSTHENHKCAGDEIHRKLAWL